jgi:hypothetical protein
MVPVTTNQRLVDVRRIIPVINLKLGDGANGIGKIPLSSHMFFL